MKIAFVSVFYPYRGGIAQFNAALYRALEKSHEVKAFNFSLQYPQLLFPGKTQFVDEKDSADTIPNERLINSINPFSYRKAAKEIENYQPDLVIIGYWMPFMAPSLGYIAKRLAKTSKVISIVHNAIPHEQSKLDGVLSNYFFKRNTYCVALSQAVAEDINREFPTVQTKVLPHPVYEHFGSLISQKDALQSLDLPENKKYLLFFGLIRDYKGLDNLLLAMKHLPGEYSLLIAGEVYGSFDTYQAIIDKEELSDRVHLFLKYIPDNEVNLYFSVANSVVLPYKSGTQSGIIAIAKHFGKPVVATDVGGLSEFIEEGKDGIMVEPNQVERLAEGIQKSVELSVEPLANTGEWERFSEEIIQF